MDRKRLSRSSYLKRRYNRLYNKTASIYDSRYHQEQETKYEIVLRVLKIRNADSALDLGCGTGLFIRHIVDYNGIIVGVDASRKMLDEAREVFGSLTNVSLVCSDADFLPLTDNMFNLVFAFTLLQNMPYPEQTIREILRVAAFDSIIVLTAQKRSFTKERFMSMLENMGLHVSSFFDDGELKDYIAICEKK